MRCWRIVLLVFILATTSCGGSHTAPRQPVKLASLQTAATNFDHMASGLHEASISGDKQAVNNLFTEDAEAHDRTFGDDAVGPQQIAGLISVVSSSSTKTQLMDQYIGLENGLTVDHMWNFTLGATNYTQDQPMIEVDWLQIRDNRIAYWSLYYALDIIEGIGMATSTRLDQARTVLSSYQAAWSSGDTQAVAELYASDAVREDMVFMERQEGQKSIVPFAETFFKWYPGVQWNLSLGFGDGMGDAPVTGGLYVITVNDLNGQPCEVRAAVLLQTSENLITHETLYYESQSLIKCGWAQ
jgi:ketosteroid isomerase-like protein